MKSEILSETFQILLRKLLGITCFLISGPFIVTILIFLYIYRRLVEIVLKIQLKDKFAGMLTSSDAIWSIEDVSLSVPNTVLIVKKPAGSTNTTFLKNIQNFFSHLSKTVPTGCEKLFYYRYQKYGYFYWDKSHKFNPETAIRWLDCEISNCDGSCEDVHSTTFQENLGFICNKPLYDNHKPMWEMLIGRRCPKSSSYIEEKNQSLSPEDCFNTDVDEIPVVFRIHHSICDGIATFNMINEIIADEGMIKKQSSIMELKNDISTANEHYLKEKQKLFPGIKFIPNLKQLYNKIKEMLGRIIYCVIIIVFSIEMMVTEFFRSIEKSVLRGKPLTGEKLIYFWMENNADKSQLFMKIKKIKRCTGARVNDIILTAFAAGLSRYYSRIKEILPNTVSVLIPTRTFTSDKKLELINDFSCLSVKCCFVEGDRKDMVTLNKHFRFFERLQKTASTNNRIRNSLEEPLNFFLMNHLSGIVPAIILRFFTAYFCVMVYSNIKGIRRKIHIVKHPVSNMISTMPHRSTTGLTLTVLTYEDKLNLFLLVDKAIIKDRKLIKEIVEETVREINSAYDSLA